MLVWRVSSCQADEQLSRPPHPPFPSLPYEFLWWIQLQFARTWMKPDSMRTLDRHVRAVNFSPRLQNLATDDVLWSGSTVTCCPGTDLIVTVLFFISLLPSTVTIPAGLSPLLSSWLCTCSDSSPNFLPIISLKRQIWLVALAVTLLFSELRLSRENVPFEFAC